MHVKSKGETFIHTFFCGHVTLPRSLLLQHFVSRILWEIRHILCHAVDTIPERSDLVGWVEG